MTAYLAAAAPVYATLSRMTGQLGGLLLLSMHHGAHGLRLDHELYRAAREQVAEVEERLSAVLAPKEAACRVRALGQAAEILRRVLRYMDRLAPPGIALHGSGAQPEPRRLLHLAYGLLRSTAQPGAGLSMLDLDHVCCNCAGQGSAKARTLPGEAPNG